jgi:hypothetical protein
LELNNLTLPTNLPIANNRNFYLCTLCAFALKKSFLSFLSPEKSKRNTILYEDYATAELREGWQKIYSGAKNSNNS